mgnify:CR=1 FL=1|jgi:hypothetical protein
MRRRDAETLKKTKRRKNAGRLRFSAPLEVKTFSEFFRLVPPAFVRKISLSFCLCSLFFVFAAHAQNLPDKIRGYKIHKAKVAVTEQNGDKSGNEDFSVSINFGKAEFAGFSPLGATFEIPAEIFVSDISGKIDFLSFHDFRVDGLRVEIEEYRESFQIEKNKPIALKKPVRVFVPSVQAFKGGLREIFASRDEWRIEGRVFVFGRFKKFGFTFKRVVPVDADFKIRNPLREG